MDDSSSMLIESQCMLVLEKIEYYYLFVFNAFESKNPSKFLEGF